MSSQKRRFGHLLFWAAAALTGLMTTGCDNAACVYGGDCGGIVDPPLGMFSAAAPGNDAWLLTGAPTVTGFFPSSGAIHSQTPIVVVFSESMAGGTLAPGGAGSNLLLFDLDGPVGEVPVPTQPPTLIGNGRMLVVLPVAPLTADHRYELRWRENAVVTDLTGTALTLPADLFVGAITADTTDPTTPRTIATWPADGELNQGSTTEIAVVFDRPMEDSSISVQSFEVTIGAPPTGVPPVNNTRPAAISVGLLTSDTRAYVYRNADGLGNVAGFGPSANVFVTLSKTGAKISAEDLSVLPATTSDFDFTTSAFESPFSAAITSTPTDAIGIDNLIDPTATLRVEVSVDALATDRLGVFLFGESKTNPGEVDALFRDVLVSALTIPYDALGDLATLTETELALGSGTPVVSPFADGTLTIALRLQRGNDFSSVRLLDVDTNLLGAQSPLLDVTRPTFRGFGSSGPNLPEFRSDLRDLAVVGRANERIRVAIVTAGAADNMALSTMPPVIGSDDAGLFVAAPVRLGLVDRLTQPVSFDVQLFDQALNASANLVLADFYQVGALGTGALGATLDIEVLDRRTLAPVNGAAVFVHQDNAGTVTSLGPGQLTGVDGLVTVNTAPVGDTIVTVDAFGYDLWTFQAVPTDRLSVPLQRGTNAPGNLSGTISSLLTNGNFTSYKRWVADSRSLTLDNATIEAPGCNPNLPAFSNQCTYGSLPIRTGPVRSVSFVAVNTTNLTAMNFSALGFLKAYFLEIPLAEPTPFQASTFDFRVDVLLDGVGVPAEELAVDGPMGIPLTAVGVAGLDLNTLDEPEISVDAKLASLHGTSLIGFGAALAPVGMPADSWSVYTAVPGIADPAPGVDEGRLISDGLLVRSDMTVRCELRDAARNRSVHRFPFAFPPPGGVMPIDIPAIQAPVGTSMGIGYDLDFNGVLPAGGGLYCATLFGLNGRRWEIYREALSGGLQTVRVVDLAGAGGTGLPDGAVSAVVEAWGWTGYDPTDLLFTDVERDYSDYAAGAGVTYTQTP
jgi:hypothetical protein